jgi:hypothetical protein
MVAGMGRRRPRGCGRSSGPCGRLRTWWSGPCRRLRTCRRLSSYRRPGNGRPDFGAAGAGPPAGAGIFVPKRCPRRSSRAAGVLRHWTPRTSCVPRCDDRENISAFSHRSDGRLHVEELARRPCAGQRRQLAMEVSRESVSPQREIHQTGRDARLEMPRGFQEACDMGNNGCRRCSRMPRVAALHSALGSMDATKRRVSPALAAQVARWSRVVASVKKSGAEADSTVPCESARGYAPRVAGGERQPFCY